MVVSEPGRVWTVAEAKARLSEILRLAETEGPQRIGKRSSFRRGAGARMAGTCAAGTDAVGTVARREHVPRGTPPCNRRTSSVKQPQRSHSSTMMTNEWLLSWTPTWSRS